MDKKRVGINFQDSRKLPQAHKKCAMKMKETSKQRNKKKQCACKNIIEGRKHFIGCLQKTGENNWDKLRDNDSGHNEGTTCLVNGQMGARGMVF